MSLIHRPRATLTPMPHRYFTMYLSREVLDILHVVL